MTDKEKTWQGKEEELKEIAREYSRKWRKENKERKRESDRRYREKNLKIVRQKDREGKATRCERNLMIYVKGKPIHYLEDLENFLVKEIILLLEGYCSKNDCEQGGWSICIKWKMLKGKDMGKWFYIDHNMKEEVLRFVNDHQKMKEKTFEANQK